MYSTITTQSVSYSTLTGSSIVSNVVTGSVIGGNAMTVSTISTATLSVNSSTSTYTAGTLTVVNTNAIPAVSAAIIAPNMSLVGASGNLFVLGQATTQYNSMVMGWFSVGAGSTSNYLNINGYSNPTGGLNITAGGNIGIGITNPNALLTSYGNSNLGSSASSITTVAGTLNQTSGLSGGPFMYQSQWDTPSTSTHTVTFISQLTSYTGGPYNSINIFNNMMGIITIYVRNTALTGYATTQYFIGHPTARATTATQITSMTYSSGDTLFISYSFDGVSTGNIFVNTNQGGTSPSIQICWTINAAS